MNFESKIKRDFLKLFGNENPTYEKKKKLECIPDSQLLKPIIEDLKKKGVALKMIALRYNVGIGTVEHISRTIYLKVP